MWPFVRNKETDRQNELDTRLLASVMAAVVDVNVIDRRREQRLAKRDREYREQVAEMRARLSRMQTCTDARPPTALRRSPDDVPPPNIDNTSHLRSSLRNIRVSRRTHRHVLNIL